MLAPGTWITALAPWYDDEAFFTKTNEPGIVLHCTTVGYLVIAMHTMIVTTFDVRARVPVH